MNRYRLIRSGLIALLLAAACAGPVSNGYAQGSDAASNITQSGEDSSEQGGFGEPGAPVAQVGAGTTDASTTGFSGPESNVQATPGEITLPPLPSPDVCESYKGGPAYESCLRVVLRSH